MGERTASPLACATVEGARQCLAPANQEILVGAGSKPAPTIVCQAKRPDVKLAAQRHAATSDGAPVEGSGRAGPWGSSPDFPAILLPPHDGVAMRSMPRRDPAMGRRPERGARSIPPISARARARISRDGARPSSSPRGDDCGSRLRKAPRRCGHDVVLDCPRPQDFLVIDRGGGREVLPRPCSAWKTGCVKSRSSFLPRSIRTCGNRRSSRARSDPTAISPSSCPIFARADPANSRSPLLRPAMKKTASPVLARGAAGSARYALHR